jgi:hypothetical protein
MGAQQLSDADGITPNYLGGNIGWITAGTKNDDLAPGIWVARRSKLLSVETGMNP